MPQEGSLLHHLVQVLNRHPNVKPGDPVMLYVTLPDGTVCRGNLHATFDDGIAIVDDAALITYVPLTGMASVSFHHPGLAETPNYRA